ncbi:MAG TPA: DUF397 domain-containing protein [Pseudonocardiaceae bacterium]|jgi:hypothetical protein|nr:DUF397 domain-containing protein [Pseudonocardiaceae bacterium]
MTHGPHRWRKSSYSSQSTDCVELAGSMDRLRDSKNPAGPALRVDLATFLTDVKSGRISR